MRLLFKKKLDPSLHLIEKNDKQLYTTQILQHLSQKSNSMSTQLDRSTFDHAYFEQKLPQLYRTILKSFRKIGSQFLLFNLLFTLLVAAELTSFFLFSPILFQSALLALSLSCLFLTVFSYFVLLFYFQAKKPEQFVQLKDQFLFSSQKLIGVPKGETEHHLSLAAALTKLAAYLDDFECHFYPIPPSVLFLKTPLEKLFARFHFHDVFRFKQILLHAAIDEHLHQLRITPTDLEVHASLANTYVSLSQLFIEPKQPKPSYFYRKRKEAFEENFRIASTLAIEEFQILNSYAPNDPWVHEQLAAGYRDLHMPDEEIKEVEILLKLRPQDRELLLRLGLLYFEQGSNAKGLSIYEELKQTHFKKAEQLITVYGKPQDSRLSCEIL